MRKKPSVAPCRRPATFAGAALLLLAGAAVADDRPMSTDRPDLTEGATVVGDGTIQVETGLLTSFSDRPEVTTTTLPTLVRFGLGNWIELRGASNVYQRVSLERFSIDGFAPVELGVKVAVLDPGRTGGPLALAALAHVGIPSGERPFAREEYGALYKVAASVDLGGVAGFGLNVGAVVEDEETLWQFTSVLGASLSEQWGVFAEVATEILDEDSDQKTTVIDGGVTLAATPDLQFDASIGSISAENRFEDDDLWFFGIGASFRFRDVY